MHNEVNILSKKWKRSILHKRCPFFSAEQTVRRWTPLGGLVLPAKNVAKFDGQMVEDHKVILAGSGH